MENTPEGSYLYSDPEAIRLQGGKNLEGSVWSLNAMYAGKPVRWLPSWKIDERGVWVQVKQSMTPEQRMDLIKEKSNGLLE